MISLEELEIVFDWDAFLPELDEQDNTMLRVQIENSPVPLVSQADERGFTLLHHAVLKCAPGKLGSLIKIV